MNSLYTLMDQVYWFLTDFIINSANLLGLTYMETNGLLFGILFPGYTFTMITIGLLRRVTTSENSATYKAQDTNKSKYFIFKKSLNKSSQKQTWGSL